MIVCFGWLNGVIFQPIILSFLNPQTFHHDDAHLVRDTEDHKDLEDAGNGGGTNMGILPSNTAGNTLAEAGSSSDEDGHDDEEKEAVYVTPGGPDDIGDINLDESDDELQTTSGQLGTAIEMGALPSKEETAKTYEVGHDENAEEDRAP